MRQWKNADMDVRGHTNGVVRDREASLTSSRTQPPCPHYQGNVLALYMTKSQGFKYKSGMYMFVKCPDISKFEWHPFSVTSAPGDEYFVINMVKHLPMLYGLSEKQAEAILEISLRRLTALEDVAKEFNVTGMATFVLVKNGTCGGSLKGGEWVPTICYS